MPLFGVSLPADSARRVSHVSKALMNMANVYKNQGKYEEALEMHTKSLQIKTRVYGGDWHPLVADCLRKIGNVSGCRGNRAAATEMYSGIPHLSPDVL